MDIAVQVGVIAALVLALASIFGGVVLYRGSTQVGWRATGDGRHRRWSRSPGCSRSWRTCGKRPAAPPRIRSFDLEDITIVAASQSPKTTRGKQRPARRTERCRALDIRSLTTGPRCCQLPESSHGLPASASTGASANSTKPHSRRVAIHRPRVGSPPAFSIHCQCLATCGNLSVS